MTLEMQLEESLRRKLAGVNDIVAQPAGEMIRDRMMENTESGRAFGNDPYVNQYSRRYAARKKGGNISPVTLRDEKYSIEKFVVSPKKGASGGARIELPSDTQRATIFRYHHEGTARGGKVRSIFPKQAESVSPDIRDQVKEMTLEALRDG
jgi:hypothetical protein